MGEPSRFVLSGGLRLAVYEQGVAEGPTVLLVHGYPDSARVFDGLAAALGERFRVVRFDVRGAGRSQAPGYRAGYRLGQLGRDVAAVARAVADGPVHLVGHDWGSVQGWQAVTDFGGLFASFTSLSGPFPAHVRGRLSLNQALHSWYMLAFQLPVLPELIMGSRPVIRLLRTRGRDAMNGLELYRANVFGPVSAARRVEVPVQQIVLSGDRFVRPAVLRTADEWCARLYRRSLAAGHWSPRDQPERVAALVTEFLDYLAGSPRPSGLERVTP